MRLLKDSLVTVFNPQEKDVDSLYIQMKIGEFPRIGIPRKDRNGADVYDVPTGVQVLACDPTTGKSGWYDVGSLTHETNCHTVKVTVCDRDVIVSDNESLAVFDSVTGKLTKVKPDKDEHRLVPIFKKDPRDFGPFGDRDLGWLFGAFVSDGWISGHYVGYAKLEDSKRKEFIRINRMFHDNFVAHEYVENPEKSTDRKLGNSKKVHLNSGSLVDWWNQWQLYDTSNGDSGALAKCINFKMLQYGSEDFMWGLLSGMLDGDGSIVKNTFMKKPRFSCRFSTSSIKLCESLKALCYRLGIRTTTTVTPPRGFSRTSYTVALSTVDMWNNLDKLTCIGESEKALIQEWKANPPGMDKHDMVPISDSDAKILRSFASVKGEASGLYNILHRSCHSFSYGARAILMKYMDLLKAHTPELYARVLETNTLWYPIDEIEDAGNREVFDLLVEDAKVYAVNNGFIVWDTVNIHVPVSDAARKEAMDRMRPSRNLLTLANHKIMNKPEKEYMQGLYIATRMGKSPDGRARIFRTFEEAREAYRNGEIDVDTPINIIGDGARK